MKDFIIVQQGLTPLSIHATSIEDSLFLTSAVQHMLPAGSHWSHFTGARCFKLSKIHQDAYLLSYTSVFDTFVIDGVGRLPAGTLHSWGLVAHPAEFLTYFEQGISIVDIFITHSSLFSVDILVDEMLNHLNQEGNDYQFKPNFSWWFSKLRLQVGGHLRLTFPFYNSQNWILVEDSITNAFYSTLWKAKLGRKIGRSPRLSTFTTFSLSLRESVQILATPESLLYTSK